MHPDSPIADDMRRLDSLLRDHVAPYLPASSSDLRILNLACGRCDEAETLMNFANSLDGRELKLIGADIRIREILAARERCANLPAEFLLEDATNLTSHKELGEDFNLVLLRHQNFWHEPDIWKKIFEQGVDKAGNDGLIVITSYFDKEHHLALEALQNMGAELIVTQLNERARKLRQPGKCVDKHIAVLRRKS